MVRQVSVLRMRQADLSSPVDTVDSDDAVGARHAAPRFEHDIAHQGKERRYGSDARRQNQQRDNGESWLTVEHPARVADVFADALQPRSNPDAACGLARERGVSELSRC